MMKAINIFLWVFGVTVVTLVGAGVVITNLIDPNEYKPNIEEIVEKSIGRKLTINGDLSISFFPWVGIDVKDASLSQRDGFGDQPMVSFSSAHFRLKLMPIFKKQIEIDTVLVQAPTIRMSVLPDGSTNWGDIMGSLADSHSSVEESSPEAAGTLGLASLVIEGVSIVNGKVIFEDQSVPRKVVLSDVNLSTDQLIPGEPLDVQLSMVVDANQLPNSLTLALVTTVETSLDFTHVTLDQTRFDVIEPGSGYALLAPKAVIDRSQQTITVKELSLSKDEDLISINDLKVASFASASQLSVEGKLAASIKHLQELLNQYGTKADFGLHEIAKVNVNGGFQYSGDQLAVNSLESTVGLNGQTLVLSLPYFNFDLSDQSLEVPLLTIQQNDSSIAISKAIATDVAGGLANMMASAKLQASGEEVPSLLQQHHIDVLPEGLGRSVDLNVQFLLNDNQLEVPEFSVKMDEMELSGEMRIRELSGDPSYEFAIKAGELDIDRLLGQLNADSVAATAEPAQVALLPIASLQGLNAEGSLSVERVIASNIALTDLNIDVLSVDDTLTLPMFKIVQPYVCNFDLG
ncbi:MAG: AsmA family protein [Gammaproteobacteria bacterium]|nr:AsmA family protein [Gammaproteobacteria bacterium]